MKTRALAPLLLLLVAATLHATSWEELLADRLDSSIAYRQAAMRLRRAELGLAQLNELAPYVTVSAGAVGPGGELIADGELAPVAVTPVIEFAGVLGADVTLRAPLVLDPVPAADAPVFSPGTPSLRVERRLFPETDVALLEARAELIRAQSAHTDALVQTRLALADEIVRAWTSRESLRIARARLEIASQELDLSRNPAVSRELERSVLQARRNVLTAERALRPIDERITANAGELRAEAAAALTAMTSDMPERGEVPPDWAEVQAQELTLAAAESAAARAFLAYAPNPTFSVSLGYDVARRSLSWGASVQLSATLLDRGERSFEAYERRERAVIERLRLERSSEDLHAALDDAWEQLELLELEREINAIDLERQEETLAQDQELLAGGFISNLALSSARLDLATARLEMEQTEHEYRMAQARIASYFTTRGNE